MSLPRSPTCRAGGRVAAVVLRVENRAKQRHFELGAHFEPPNLSVRPETIQPRSCSPPAERHAHSRHLQAVQRLRYLRWVEKVTGLSSPDSATSRNGCRSALHERRIKLRDCSISHSSPVTRFNQPILVSNTHTENQEQQSQARPFFGSFVL